MGDVGIFVMEILLYISGSFWLPLLFSAFDFKFNMKNVFMIYPMLRLFMCFDLFALVFSVLPNSWPLTLPVLPSIFPFSFDGEVNEGDSVQLTCHVAKGDLPLRIRWTHNDLPLFPHLGIMASKIGERVSLLTVETVKAVHSGNYSCVASNNAGNISYTAELLVNGLINHISVDWFALYYLDSP